MNGIKNRLYISYVECKSCGNKITGNYCAHCGEKAYSRIQLKDLLSDFLSNLLALEAPILKTIKDLTIRPGSMCRDYLNGIRKPYYKPFQYYLIWLTVYYAIFFVIGDQFYDMFQTLHEPKSNASQETIESYNELLTMLQRFQAEYMKIFMFLQVPITLVMFKLFYWRKEYNLTEHTVTVLYHLGHGLFLNSVLALCIFAVEIEVYFQLNTILSFAYLTFFLCTLYKGKILINILKSLTIFVISTILFSSIVVAMSLLRVYLAYNVLPTDML